MESSFAEGGSSQFLRHRKDLIPPAVIPEKDLTKWIH